MRPDRRLAALLALILILTFGCGDDDAGQPRERPLRVVASTTIVSDVVKQVGGQRIELATLLPVGADPHTWTPTPDALKLVAEADIVFINGIGLEEEFLGDLVEQSGSEADIVSVSNGIRPRHFKELAESRKLAGAGDRVRALKEEGRVDSMLASQDVPPMLTSDPDPHVWMNPHNVMVWAANIQEALGRHDVANGEYFAEKAEWYKTKLVELDAALLAQVEAVPPLKRRLVTGHLFLGYFADRYGFTQIGAILPGKSTLGEPGAKNIARLEEVIRRMKVPAIFAGIDLSNALAERIAEDLRTDLRLLYTGSLSETGGPAGNYIEYMTYNVKQITEGLNPPREPAGDPSLPLGVRRGSEQ